MLYIVGVKLINEICNHFKASNSIENDNNFTLENFFARFDKSKIKELYK